MPTATADPEKCAGRCAERDDPYTFRVLAGWIERCRGAARRPVASASTTAFRVAFGLLIVGSTIRFVSRGWVEEFYLAPANHLTYADAAWVRPLPPVAMYAHMAVLVVLGVSIAVGYRTRLAAGLFAIGFAYVELLDAALYLNHYWFVTLAAVTLAIAPSASGRTVPAVTVWALRAQLAAVYVFAGIAKLNPDWLLRGEPMGIWLAARTDRPLVGPLLDEQLVAHLFSWAGAVFDLTIVGWLLWRRSRPFAYAAVVCFHATTAMLFQIGVFPWVMIALTPIFFDPEWPLVLRRRLFGRSADGGETDGGGTDGGGTDGGTDAPTHHRRRIGRTTSLALGALVIVNIVLPLRHYAADGNVRFNDDGYYLSWRVMLTERAGFLEFDVRDRSTGSSWTVRPELVLASWQAAQATRRPDLALTTAHLIDDYYEQRGQDVAVFANSWVSFNGHPRQRWIDPTVDLASLPRTAPGAGYVLPIEPTRTP